MENLFQILFLIVRYHATQFNLGSKKFNTVISAKRSSPIKLLTPKSYLFRSVS